MDKQPPHWLFMSKEDFKLFEYMMDVLYCKELTKDYVRVLLEREWEKSKVFRYIIRL